MLAKSATLPEMPQICLEAFGHRRIAVTQPRKVAATSLAGRVAKECRCRIGGLVGYSVRFDQKASADTRILFLTDGMLARELLMDPFLLRYDLIIIDEAHERTLRTDILLMALKTILVKRNAVSESGKASKPLQLIIMSATLDAQRFSEFFNQYVSVCN